MPIIQRPWKTQATVASILKGRCADLQHFPDKDYKKDNDFLGQLTSTIGKDFWSHTEATRARIIELEKEHQSSHKLGTECAEECAEFAARATALSAQKGIFQKLFWEYVGIEFPATTYTDSVMMAKDWSVICKMDQPFVPRNELLFPNVNHISNTLIKCLTEAFDGQGDDAPDPDFAPIMSQIGEVCHGVVEDKVLRSLWNIRRRLKEAKQALGGPFVKRTVAQYEDWARCVTYAEVILTHKRSERLGHQIDLIQSLFWASIRENFPNLTLTKMLDLRQGWQVVGIPALEQKVDEAIREFFSQINRDDDEDDDESE